MADDVRDWPPGDRRIVRESATAPVLAGAAGVAAHHDRRAARSARSESEGLDDAPAAADVNPDRNQRPSPVVVRVYQLRTDTSFQAAQFEPLYDDDRKTLGEAFLTRDEFTLDPGQRQVIDVSLAIDTRYVGSTRRVPGPDQPGNCVEDCRSGAQAQPRRGRHGQAGVGGGRWCALGGPISDVRAQQGRVVGGPVPPAPALPAAGSLLRALRRVAVRGPGARTDGASPSSRSTRIC